MAYTKTPASPEELRRRHREREKRREGTPEGKAKRKAAEARRRARRRADAIPPAPTPQQTSRFAMRAELVEGFNRRKRLPPGYQRAEGPYSGDGFVVGPLDYDEWLSWSRGLARTAREAA